MGPELLEDAPRPIHRRIWFQHDGALSYFFRNVQQYLDNSFPGKWIRRNGPVAWPARSPGMTSLDFYRRDHINSFIYETPVESEMDIVGRMATGR